MFAGMSWSPKLGSGAPRRLQWGRLFLFAGMERTMAQATFRAGKPLMLDYTPSSAVNAGDVVLSGNRPLIAHTDIAANTKGSVAAGGCVYDATAGEALNAGDKVYWDDASKKIKKTVGAGQTHYHFGFVVPDSSASADGDTVRVQHQPDGSTISG